MGLREPLTISQMEKTKMNQPNKATIYATILVVAAAALTSGALYMLSTQPATQQQTLGITFGEPPPDGMPGLNNHPNEPFPDNGTDGPKL
jgi:hypothetical protein